MAEHTPLPWKRANRGIVGGDGKLVAKAWLAYRDSNTYFANAAVIVRAVNMHERLMAALIEFMAYEPPDYAPQEAWDIARALLAEAEKDK